MGKTLYNRLLKKDDGNPANGGIDGPFCSPKISAHSHSFVSASGRSALPIFGETPEGSRTGSLIRELGISALVREPLQKLDQVERSERAGARFQHLSQGLIR
jgi:hypothetical protein